MKLPPFFRIIIVVFCFSAVGCVTPPKDHYYWGNYETLLLTMYAEPGVADSFTQIEQLTVDIQQAENNGKPVPPGLYAHLGMMYALNGDASQAEAAFHKERDFFPESEVLIDGMMARSIARSPAWSKNSNAPAQ
jgi:hypothetical protein